MYLTSFEKRWAVAVMEGFAPAGNRGLSPEPGEIDYLGSLLAMARASTPLARTGLRLALWLTALAPLWMLGRFRSVVTLSANERAALLERLMAHPLYLLRELGIYLKLATCMALFARRSLRDRSNYFREHTTPRPVVRLAVLRPKEA
jgi:hypothetical protein